MWLHLFFGHYLRGEWKDAQTVVEKYIAEGFQSSNLTSMSIFMWTWLTPEAVARAGNWEEALRLAEGSLEIFQQIGFPYGLNVSHMALGLAHAGQMNWDDALKAFDQGLQIAQRMKHPWDTATILHEMGIVHAKRDENGDREKARRVFEEALKIFTELKAQPSVDKVNKSLELIAS